MDEVPIGDRGGKIMQHFANPAGLPVFVIISKHRKTGALFENRWRMRLLEI
jgi:hypothetical protein